jgi:hypothetical protein
MQGYQIYATVGINDCTLIPLHASAHTLALVDRRSPSVPVGFPGHAIHSPHPYPQSRHRRR